MDQGSPVFLAYSRTLTSAWIETLVRYIVDAATTVALSRVRGLKPLERKLSIPQLRSHSHECVD